MNNVVQLTEEEMLLCARASWEAEKAHREIKMLTLTYPQLDRPTGYQVQNIRTGLVEQEGHRVVGYKLGSTGLKKRQQMGTATSSYGRLFDYMRVEPGQPVKLDELIHPKVEPEITFVLKDDLTGPNVTAAQVMRATGYVTASLEIIDSRYENFKFAGGDVVSDNISGGKFLLSEKRYDPFASDLSLIGLEVTLNGKVCGQGAVCEIMGHPARAVAEFANVFWKNTGGQGLKAGQFIMTGGITQAFSLSRGDHVKARFGRLGPVEFDVV